MGMITHILGQTAKLYRTTTNEYGDRVMASSLSIPCRFRQITEQDRGTNMEYTTADALLWVEPTVALAESDIVTVDGSPYRVQRITLARKFGATVEFKKCLMEKSDGVVS